MPAFVERPASSEVHDDTDPAKAMTQAMRDLVDWLPAHDLAHFFVEDVDLREFPAYRNVSYRDVFCPRHTMGYDGVSYC